jgi:hypothetical protein
MASSLSFPAVIAAAFLLAGCDPQPAMPTGPATLGKLPAEACTKVAEALTKLAEGAIFEHNGKGWATMSEPVWYSLKSPGQEQLARSLALDAACKQSDAPREMQVSIRGAESGRNLSTRVVEIAPGADMFFEDD